MGTHRVRPRAAFLRPADLCLRISMCKCMGCLKHTISGGYLMRLNSSVGEQRIAEWPLVM